MKFSGRLRRVAAFGVITLMALVIGSPTHLRAQGIATLIISEVHPSGSGNPAYGADWIEITNVGTAAANLAGWKIDDNSNAPGSAVALRGILSIPAGESAVYFEGNPTGSTDDAIKSSLSLAWFGTPTPPPGVLIGAYGGSGVGLGTGGDAVNLFDAAGNRITGVAFGLATATRTFDNTAGIGSTTLPLPTISTLSTAGVNGAFTAGTETGSPGRIAAPPSFSTIDLSTYVRIGRFPLPEPLTVTPPPNSLLAQEASAVAYNWDTDTLFITGDGGLAIVQVNKTGQLIDSMTLALGSSPQGTDFYDPEGITYVGNGRFVMIEERDRQAVLFTYAANTTLTRANTQTVKLGTFAPNIGIEGISYDPMTGGFIAVKETQPQGIFQTNIDFAAGTATNGSATTENSINLFEPALLSVLDLADVFALSNLPTISGPERENLLVLSQESGRVLNVDREGNVASALNILPYDGQTLTVAEQQHEGLTMDGNGILYIVNENGGGNIDHPELWVYAPALAPNQAPTGISLPNQLTSIAENTVIAPRRKVADVSIADDGLGTNNLTVTGADAASFEVDLFGLYLRAGTSLDFETKPTYNVTVAVNDPSLGGNPDATATFALSVTDVPEVPPTPPSVAITEVAPWASSNSPAMADWFELTNTGTNPFSVDGWKMDDDSNSLSSARDLTGITTIAPGESVIFMETANLAATAAAFRTAWFGANPPAGLQVGAYTGSGVGLSTGGDAVNVFDATGAVVARVTFSASPTGPFRSFDNAAGINNGGISQLSVAGVNGAFVAANDANEIGSPGQIAAPASLIISEVAPWSSGNSPVAADWFEVTNIGASAGNIAGWKVDDSSESPAGAALLNGVTTIAPGESVIFIETADLAGARMAFVNTWFGGTAPAGLQIGNYTGSGLGLATSGDAVNLYNPFDVLQSKVFFGSASSGSPIATFDNAAGINFAGISLLSVAGTNGAFVAAASAEVGSPGTIVADTVPPTMEPAADVFVSAIDSTGSFASYATPPAHDNVDFTVAVACAPASGSHFALGNNLVTCQASDAALNTSTPVTFILHVNDTTPPVLAPIGNVAVTTAGSGATVNFVTVASDNVSASAAIVVTCTPPSGSSFAPGTTIVSCTARDEAGNTSAAQTFSVTVNRAPIAGSDTAAVFEGGTVQIAVLANDLDPDGDPVSLQSVTGASHGSTSIGSGGVIVYTPTVNFAGTDSFSYVIKDGRGGSAIGTVTVTVGRLGRFVALSRDLTWLRAGAIAHTGDVGAVERRASDHGGDGDRDDDRRNVTVRIGVGAEIRQAGSRVVGDTVLLQNRSSVYNVIDNDLIAQRQSSILGTETSSMPIPFAALPAFPTVQAGNATVSVAKNASNTLAPGKYGAIKIAQGGTLILSGGLYQVESIDLAASATIVVRAATELRVKTDVVTRAKARLMVDPAVAGLTASKFVIYVAGRDEDCRRVDADDDGDDAGPVTVHIGTQNVVQANIMAARGTVWLKSKTTATGAFIGMHVRIGVKTELRLDSAFQ